MGLTPTFKLVANGKDITAIIDPHVQQITLTDKVGFEADTVEVQLQDAGDDLLLPTPGATLTVYLGYRETSLQQLGQYTIDEIETSGPPSQLVIRGKSADMLSSLKTPKTRAWHHLADSSGKLTLASLLGAIAHEHHLIPKLSEPLQALHLHHPIQTNESDLHFLTRIARGVGAITKPAAGHLLMLQKGLAKTLSGHLLPAIDLNQSRIYRWSMVQRQRHSYKQVVARYYDQAQASEKQVTAGEGSPRMVIGQLFKNEHEAQQAANAKLADVTQGERTLQIDLPGDPNLIAESHITLSGIKAGVDGDWNIDQVVHSFSASGYHSQVSAIVSAE